MAAAKKLTLHERLPKILLISYIVFSFLFILMSVYQNAKYFVYDTGVQSGIQRVGDAALDPKCGSFNVQSSQGAVQLINVACLKQATEAPASEVQ